MREDLPQTEYLTEYDRFVELLTSPKYAMTDASIVNEDMFLVSYRINKEFIQGSKHNQRRNCRIYHNVCSSKVIGNIKPPS